MPFQSIVDRNRKCGNGILTDGEFKIVVRIINFEERDYLKTGAHVVVNGEIRWNSRMYHILILLMKLLPIL